MRTYVICLFVVVGTALASLVSRGWADDKGSGKAKKPIPVNVIVDLSDAPEAAAWVYRAKPLVEKWHPIIAEMLKSDGFVPASEVKLLPKKDMKIPAATSGNVISISVDHISQHPDDYGMIIHELVHVLQRYPKFDKDNWWLVEGIADYIRFYRFEPKAKLPRIDPSKASFRDGYKTSARFLAWIERKHDRAIIKKLNLALRRGEYRPELFEEWTKQGLDQLWVNFIRAMPAR
jgi:hypothetical protein